MIEPQIYGNDHDQKAIEQLKNCMQIGGAVGGCLMADGHLGYSLPIGGVLVTKDQISPNAVGFDIGCGNRVMAIGKSPDIKKNIKSVLEEIREKIPFGVGCGGEKHADHDFFRQVDWGREPLKSLEDLARQQLGSVGSGNHYVDIFESALHPEKLSIGVHFGSRGFGYKIAEYFLRCEGSNGGMESAPVFLNTGSIQGALYIKCMSIAQEFAKISRRVVCEDIAKILGVPMHFSQICIDNHHNFASLEMHGGEYLWVTRKGSTKVSPGRESFIGGSMGDPSFVVSAIPGADLDRSFKSAPHGAGRVMGRMQAKGKSKTDKETGERRVIREGLVSKQMMNEWLAEKGVVLVGGGVDESPHVYRRLDEVLAMHPYLRATKQLNPIGVIMA